MHRTLTKYSNILVEIISNYNMPNRKKTNFLGNLLRTSRKPLTIDQAAEALSINKNTLGAYERGVRHPDVDFLFAFSRLTETSLEALVLARLQDIEGFYLPDKVNNLSEFFDKIALHCEAEVNTDTVNSRSIAKADISSSQINKLTEDSLTLASHSKNYPKQFLSFFQALKKLKVLMGNWSHERYEWLATHYYNGVHEDKLPEIAATISTLFPKKSDLANVSGKECQPGKEPLIQIETSDLIGFVISRMMIALDVNTEIELIKKLKVDKKTLSTWRFRGAIPLDKCDKLAREHGLSLDYILYGIGHPKRMDKQIQVDKNTHLTTLIEQFDLIPYYSNESYSDQLNSIESTEKNLAFKKDWIEKMKLDAKKLCLISVEGDAMYPTISHGDIALVDIRNDDGPREGGIYALSSGNGLRLKRLQQQTDGSVTMISDNPLYDREHVEAQNVPNLPILGRIVWIGKVI